ncbi:MAG: hypothetical protein HZA16_06640 [Nitrospirae bacterium]|nr:hypothetical protein [Nitrospirota bacterium]
MDNVRAEEDFTPVQNIALFALIALLVGLYKFIMDLMILNVGIGELSYPRLYLQVLPALYIIHQKFWKQSLRFPHLILMFLILLAYVLFEEFLSPFRDTAPHHYNFFWGQARMYIFFLMLVNFGIDRKMFYKVIDYTLYCILLICFITYFGYTGFFEMAFDHNVSRAIIQSSLTEAVKPHHLLHVNAVSYLFAFAILLLVIKQLNEKKYYRARLIRDFTLILLLMGLIIINAARAAFMVAIVFVCFYVYTLWRSGVKDRNTKMFLSVLMFIFIIVISALALSKFGNILENNGVFDIQIGLIKRAGVDFTEGRYEHMVRLINARNAWENFLDHPLTGMGFNDASVREGIGTIDDGQHLQLLASFGIIFFILYVYYYYKLFIFDAYLLKKPEIILGLIFVIQSSFFETPGDLVAIVAYTACYFHYNAQPVYSIKAVRHRPLWLTG